MPTYRGVRNHKHVGRFQLPSNGVHYFEINCFLKYKPILIAVFFGIYQLYV